MVGRVLYGALFVVVLPVLLWWWAHAMAARVVLPSVPWPWVGWVGIVPGAFLMAGGMLALWRRGGGLPMNAFPPARYVTEGIYRLIAHPIYVGFVLACLGTSVLTRSATGTWLVTPLVILAVTALVLGYERHDLRRRFGDAVRAPQLALPPATDDPITGWDRAAVLLRVFLPWAIVLEAVYLLGVPQDAIEAYLPFEERWPVLPWTEVVYGSAYLFVPLTLWVVRRRRDLRHFALTGLIATAVATLIYLTLPLIAPPRAFTVDSWLGRVLMLERAAANTVAAFPAFHLIWSLLAADSWMRRGWRSGAVGWLWALAIGVSCITTGMHAIADLLAAVVVFMVVRRYRCIWWGVRAGAERLANSWQAWRLGPVRIINQGVYAGLAGAVAWLIAASVAGPAVFWPLLGVHVVGLLGAGLWAQQLEGSSRLSRPFGYYGSVVGGVAGALVFGAVTDQTWILLGAIALAAPWLQAIGRLRCLVQGCCHGAPAAEYVGIRYRHPHSRVCALADLCGVPLHPTPVYSILANVVTGILLIRLWWLGVSLSLVVGAYLVLAGFARFVEEAYRGEPQTRVVAGLRFYQWLAVVSVVAGMVIMTWWAPLTPLHGPQLDGRTLGVAVGYGLLCLIALGVDFPESSRRFARLAPP